MHDDERYWPDNTYTKNNVVKLKESPVVRRSIPDSSTVMEKIEREPRAALPSPLLMQWMKEQEENK